MRSLRYVSITYFFGILLHYTHVIVFSFVFADLWDVGG